MARYEQHGLIEKLPQEHNEGNQQEIVVCPKGRARASRQIVKVSDVLIGEADSLKKALAERLDSPEVAERVFNWLRPQLPTTLSLDKRSDQPGQGQKPMAAVADEVHARFAPGDLLAHGRPAADRREHRRCCSSSTRPTWHRSGLGRSGWPIRWPTLGMFVALSVLCGVYVLHYERRLIDNLRQFATTLALIVITVGLAVLASGDNVRAELVPLVVFGMTLSIAYHRELALLFSAAADAGRGRGNGAGPERVHDPVRRRRHRRSCWSAASATAAN